MTQEVTIDLKVKSAIESNLNWYCLNLEHMMVMLATENTNSTNSNDKFYPGLVYPMRLTDKGLHYYDQNMTSWMLLEENVQRQYSDYMADKEILGE